MKSHLIVGVLSGLFSLTSFSAPLAAHKQLDLNTVQATQLTHLIKGIGEKRAHAIITYRETHHGFQRLDELAYVPGIGKHFVDTHWSEIQAALMVSGGSK